jgi:hypothetical protein
MRIIHFKSFAGVSDLGVERGMDIDPEREGELFQQRVRGWGNKGSGGILFSWLYVNLIQPFVLHINLQSTSRGIARVASRVVFISFMLISFLLHMYMYCIVPAVQYLLVQMRDIYLNVCLIR